MPPGYGTPYGQPGDVPPGYGPPAYGQPGNVPPGYGTPYGQPGDVPPGYGYAGLPPYGSGNPYGPPQPGYGPQFGLYAGPDDPLVSPDYSGWWNRAMRLLGSSWRQMAMVQLVWAVPLIAIGVGANLLSARFDTTSTRSTTSTTTVDFGPEVIVALILVLVLAMIGVLAGLVTQLATIQIAVQRATGQPVSVGAALLTGLRRAPAMLGWGILAGLLILVGLLFCFLPGIYLYVALLVLPVIILVERGKGIGRAFELFHADFGSAIGRVATIIGIEIAFGVVNYVISMAIGLSAGFGSPETIAAGPSVGVAVLSAIISVVISIASSIVGSPLLLTAYADMRARHEPFSTAYLVPAPQ